MFKGVLREEGKLDLTMIGKEAESPDAKKAQVHMTSFSTGNFKTLLKAAGRMWEEFQRNSHV